MEKLELGNYHEIIVPGTAYLAPYKGLFQLKRVVFQKMLISSAFQRLKEYIASTFKNQFNFCTIFERVLNVLFKPM